MDPAINAAVLAVGFDDDLAVQRWFELVCASHQDVAGDWERFCAALNEGAGAAGVDDYVVQQFVEHMNAHDIAPMETIGRMVEMGPDLPVLYGQLVAEEWSAGGHVADAQQDQQSEHGQAQHDVSSFPEVKEGDSGEWVEYLDAMLSSHGF